MLLGTASMVKAVNILVTKYHGGLSDLIIVFPKQSPKEVEVRCAHPICSHMRGGQMHCAWDLHPMHGHMRGIRCATHGG
jgi:hypothetical protein